MLAALALLAPWMAQAASVERVGVLLAVAAALEITQGFRRATAAAQRSAWVNGAVTLAMGVLLVNAPWLAAGALIVFLAGWFAIDGVRHGVNAARRVVARQPFRASALSALGNLAIAGGLLVLGDRGAEWATAIAGALRIFETGTNILQAPVFLEADSGRTVIDDLGLPDRPELDDLARRIEEEEARRAPVDRGWIGAFAATLFAIHLGRTGLDRSALGIMTPTLAVLGDFVVALIAAFGIIVPLRLGWRRLTRRPARRLWAWSLEVPEAGRDWRWRLTLAALTTASASPSGSAGRATRCRRR